jgi:hypothetical protein
VGLDSLTHPDDEDPEFEELRRIFQKHGVSIRRGARAWQCFLTHPPDRLPPAGDHRCGALWGASSRTATERALPPPGHRHAPRKPKPHTSFL